MKTFGVWMFAVSAVLAAVFSACVNPAGSAPKAPEAEAAGGKTAGLQETPSFTVTIPVNVPDRVTGRAVVDAAISGDAIKLGGARNTYLLAALDTATGKTVRSWEGNKETPSSANAELEDVTLPPGTYGFLLLMGHRERNYGAEGGNCVYMAGAPTLLAAGYEEVTISAGGDVIAIPMAAVTVTAAFTSTTPACSVETVEDLAEGFQLEAASDWKLTWTVSGLANLKNTLPAGTDASWLFKAVRGQAWQTGGSHAMLSGSAGFAYADKGTGTVTLSLGAPPAGILCAAWFNLEYAPDGGGESWVIRNGINDLPQDSFTDFSLDGNAVKWSATVNGNGAVRFIVAAPTVTDLDLTDGVPAPVRGGTPRTFFSVPQYEGTVAWADKDGGTSDIFDSTGKFKATVAYKATVTLTAAADRTFAGIPENNDTDPVVGTFAHGGGEVTHDEGVADTLTVAILFPATEASATVKPDDEWGVYIKTSSP